MVHILSKITGAWLLMVVAAIGNGLMRDKLLIPVFGSAALPISGLLLAAFIVLLVYLLVPLLGSLKQYVYVAIGIYWVALTLAFELAFGYLLAGKSWAQIAQVFNVYEGNLFVVVLMMTLVSPWWVAKQRGLL